MPSLKRWGFLKETLLIVILGRDTLRKDTAQIAGKEKLFVSKYLLLYILRFALRLL